MEDSSLQPLAQRRPRRARKLPARYKDIPPQPLPLLPPPTGHTSQEQQSPSSLGLTSSLTHPPPSRVLQIFRTPQNAFGLLRQYFSDRLLSHNPEEHIDLQDLLEDSAAVTDTSHQPPLIGVSSDFYPYPNESSFRLGDWYWNHGIHKSRESFRKLLNIIGDPGFYPDDVRDTQWSKVDAKLGMNDFDDGKSDGEWMDEDAGWKRTPVTISVPFAKRSSTVPGPRDFLVDDFYHRSLISVIREKLANPLDNQGFHYDPFELLWRPPGAEEVRVHGEMYTSPAFLEAYRELQEAPGEAGCNFPRVLVAMMFWSDTTQLTSFGNAKLWPTYLCFGNESKYRRCKPTCHLCNHIAYFQSVRRCSFAPFSIVLIICSFRTPSRILPPNIWTENSPVIAS